VLTVAEVVANSLGILLNIEAAVFAVADTALLRSEKRVATAPAVACRTVTKLLSSELAGLVVDARSLAVSLVKSETGAVVAESGLPVPLKMELTGAVEPRIVANLILAAVKADTRVMVTVSGLLVLLISTEAVLAVAACVLGVVRGVRAVAITVRATASVLLVLFRRELAVFAVAFMARFKDEVLVAIPDADACLVVPKPLSNEPIGLVAIESIFAVLLSSTETGEDVADAILPVLLNKELAVFEVALTILFNNDVRVATVDAVASLVVGRLFGAVATGFVVSERSLAVSLVNIEVGAVVADASLPVLLKMELAVFAVELAGLLGKEVLVATAEVATAFTVESSFATVPIGPVVKESILAAAFAKVETGADETDKGLLVTFVTEFVGEVCAWAFLPVLRIKLETIDAAA
jgi:hypothetical protein